MQKERYLDVKRKARLFKKVLSPEFFLERRGREQLMLTHCERSGIITLYQLCNIISSILIIEISLPIRMVNLNGKIIFN